jgi:uncharacterized RDD family membrane protein YckC
LQEPERAAPRYARLLPRVKALVFDLFLYVLATLTFVLVIAPTDTDLILRAGFALFVAFILLYEPLLVWRYGGTLGHMRYNLRVVSDKTGGPPGLFASVWRWYVKGFFGVLSFVFMTLTRRHQALHGVASRTTVQLRDPDRARASDFVSERSGPVGATDVSAGRRIAVIVGYITVAFLLTSFVPAIVSSDACVMQDRCTEGEELVWSAFTVGWVVFAGLALVLGWKGRLPGARSRGA